MKDLKNKIYQGDCLEVMEQFEDRSIGMILCDLPYGTTQNKWDSIIPFEPLWAQYKRIIKPDGVIALTSQGLFTAQLILSNPGWFRYKFVWVKSSPTNFLNARKQPLRKHEDVCIFYRQQPTYRPPMSQGKPYDKGVRKAQCTGSYGDFRPARVKSDGGRYPTDSLYCKSAASESGGRVWHPTQKPVALGRYFIRMFTNKNDVVLDNAFGSGSFLVAAALEGRQYIGIEKNKEGRLFKKEPVDYIDVAKRRLADTEKQLMAKQNPFPRMTPQPEDRNISCGVKGLVDVDAVVASSCL